MIKPGIRDTERMQGFDSDWTQPAEGIGRASARWALVGSAVSVPVARWLGTRILNPGSYESTTRPTEFPAQGKAPRAAYFDGRGRRVISIGTDPVGIRPPALVDFLRDVEGQRPLSLKATVGFLSRTARAKLRFEPGFLEAVRRHAQMMGADLAAAPLPAQMELLRAA